MLIFVRCDQEGNIVSTMKVNVMPEGIDHPYGHLEEGETVVKVEPTAQLEELTCHEISERYVLDVQSKELEPKE
jgi:hypothetical protein